VYGSFRIKPDAVLQRLLDSRAYFVGVAAIGVDRKFKLQSFVDCFTAKDLGTGRELQPGRGERDDEHGEGESREVLGNH
jgi:hypothetical protein